MKLTVDTTDKAWREQREVQWQALRIHPEGSPKQKLKILEAYRLIFFGEVLDKDDKRVKVLGGHWNRFMYYSPNQCEENWAVWVPDEISRLEARERPPQRGISIFINSCLGSMVEAYGWTPGMGNRLFKYLFGEHYDPDNYEFEGRKMQHPLYADGISSSLCLSWHYTISGYLHGENIWLDNYNYCVEAFKYLDLCIFEPESVIKNNKTFSDLKRDWASFFLIAHRMQDIFEEFKAKDKLHVEFQNMSFEEFMLHPRISMMYKKLVEDLENGKLPSALRALYEWARAPYADVGDLMDYTEGYEPYTNPWVGRKEEDESEEDGAEVIEPVEAAEPQVLQSVEDLIVLTESLRKSLQASGVPDLGNEVHTEDDLRLVLNASAKEEEISLDDLILELREDCSTTALIPRLIRPYSFELWVEDPFSATGEPDAAENYLQQSWRQLNKIISLHGAFGEVSVHEHEPDDDDDDSYYVVKIDKDKEEYCFHYGTDEMNFEAGELLEDMESFLRDHRYPWRLGVHELSESELLVYYLPIGAARALKAPDS